MHSTSNLEDGYMGGGNRIKNSIKKHGKEAHKKEIVEFFESRKDLRNMEIELVNDELLKDPMCMNLQLGGGGGIINEEHHLKMREGTSKWAKEKWKNPDFFILNRKLSSERLSEWHKRGNFVYNTFSNKKHTEEAKKSMGEKNSINQKGEKNSQYGTIWINDGTNNKKIKKSEFEIYSLENWKLGRI